MGHCDHIGRLVPVYYFGGAAESALISMYSPIIAHKGGRPTTEERNRNSSLYLICGVIFALHIGYVMWV